MEIRFGLAIGLWWAHHRSKKKRDRVIIPVVFDEGYAYWLADGRLVKSRARGMNPDLKKTSRVYIGGDLPPARAIEILEALEEVERAGNETLSR